MAKLYQFIRKNFVGILIALAIVSFLCEGFFSLFGYKISEIIFLITVLTIAYNKRKENLLRVEQLKEKGLTIEDTLNIKFVKNWEQARKSGVVKYCLYDGGFTIGMIIFMPVAFTLFFFLKLNRTFDEFNKMTFFLIQSLLLSYIIGVIIYRVRWGYNEQRYIKLTDPIP